MGIEIQQLHFYMFIIIAFLALGILVSLFAWAQGVQDNSQNPNLTTKRGPACPSCGGQRTIEVNWADRVLNGGSIATAGKMRKCEDCNRWF